MSNCGICKHWGEDLNEPLVAEKKHGYKTCHLLSRGDGDGKPDVVEDPVVTPAHIFSYLSSWQSLRTVASWSCPLFEPKEVKQ